MFKHFLIILVFTSLEMRIDGGGGCPVNVLPEDTVARNGSRVVLRCSEGGGVVFWSKNDVLINLQSPPCNCELQSCGDLLFPSISDTDAGDNNVYKCTVFSSSTSREVRICIEVFPVFSLGNGAFEGIEGELLKIELDYSGTCEPLTEVNLLRNSVSVQNDANIQLLHVNSKVEITFSSLRLSDHGLHTLQSLNIAGTSTTGVMILVKHKPILAEKNIFPGYMILANTTATLSCNYTGFPEVSVEWYDPNGAEITSGILISRDSNWIYSQLSLPSLAQNQGGSYRCFGVNTIGNTSHTLMISVTGPLEAAEIIEILANEVLVSWSEPPSAFMINRYRVEYMKNNFETSSWQMGTEVTVGTNETRITGLQGFTSYSLRIIYFSNQGTHFGSPVQFSTSTGAPTNAPRNIQVTALSSSTIELNWEMPEVSFSDGNSQITSYRVWWARIQDSSQIMYSFRRVDRSIRSFTLENLSPNSKYFIKVQAYTNGGPGPNSTLTEATTSDSFQEVPALLVETRWEQLNYIVEWELAGEYFANIVYFITLLNSAGEPLELIGPLQSNIRSYNFSNLDDSIYYKICVEIELMEQIQSSNCTEINAVSVTSDPITIATLNLAIWIATPVAGVILMVCVFAGVLCGLVYGCRCRCRIKPELMNKQNDLVKRATSNTSISSKNRHPYTGELVQQDPEAPKSCLKYHSDKGEDHHIQFPKHLRIGTDL